MEPSSDPLELHWVPPVAPDLITDATVRQVRNVHGLGVVIANVDALPTAPYPSSFAVRLYRSGRRGTAPTLLDTRPADRTGVYCSEERSRARGVLRGSGRSHRPVCTGLPSPTPSGVGHFGALVTAVRRWVGTESVCEPQVAGGPALLVTRVGRPVEGLCPAEQHGLERVERARADGSVDPAPQADQSRPRGEAVLAVLCHYFTNRLRELQAKADVVELRGLARSDDLPSSAQPRSGASGAPYPLRVIEANAFCCGSSPCCTLYAAGTD